MTDEVETPVERERETIDDIVRRVVDEELRDVKAKFEHARGETIDAIFDATREAVQRAFAGIVDREGQPDFFVLPPDDSENPLAKAIAEMEDAVAFDRRNNHAGYDYASADAIYAHARNALAKHGLTVWMQQVSWKAGDTINDKGHHWIWAEFDVGFQTSILHPPPKNVLERVTVCALMTGPQVCAAIRTYAQKYFVRGKCMLATGDLSEELDAEPLPGGTERKRETGGKPPRKRETKKPAGNKSNGKGGTKTGTKKADPKGETAEYYFDDAGVIMVRGTFANDKAARQELYNFLMAYVAPPEGRERGGEEKKACRDVIAKNANVIAAAFSEESGAPIRKSLTKYFKQSGIWDEDDPFVFPEIG